MVQRAYDQLEAAIIFGELKPRQRLVERQLERVLKISRTPIREALRRLESAGLIVNRPNQGAVVTDLKPHEIEDNYVLRLGLQDLAISLMRAHTRQELQQLKDLHRQMRTAYSARDYRTWMQLNSEFHEALMVPVDNPTLLQDLERVIARTYVVWRFYALGFWSDPDGPSNSMREHEQIIAAISTQNWSGLRQLMIEHTMRPVRDYFAKARIESADFDAGERLERLALMLANRRDRLPEAGSHIHPANRSRRGATGRVRKA